MKNLRADPPKATALVHSTTQRLYDFAFLVCRSDKRRVALHDRAGELDDTALCGERWWWEEQDSCKGVRAHDRIRQRYRVRHDGNLPCAQLIPATDPDEVGC